MKWRYFDIIILLTIGVVIRIVQFIKSNARNCTIINYYLYIHMRWNVNNDRRLSLEIKQKIAWADGSRFVHIRSTFK